MRQTMGLTILASSAVILLPSCTTKGYGTSVPRTRPITSVKLESSGDRVKATFRPVAISVALVGAGALALWVLRDNAFVASCALVAAAIVLMPFALVARGRWW